MAVKNREFNAWCRVRCFRTCRTFMGVPRDGRRRRWARKKRHKMSITKLHTVREEENRRVQQQQVHNTSAADPFDAGQLTLGFREGSLATGQRLLVASSCSSSRVLSRPVGGPPAASLQSSAALRGLSRGRVLKKKYLHLLRRGVRRLCRL